MCECILPQAFTQSLGPSALLKPGQTWAERPRFELWTRAGGRRRNYGGATEEELGSK